MWRNMTCLYGNAGSCSKTTVLPRYSFIQKFCGQQLPRLVKTAVHNVFFNITGFLCEPVKFLTVSKNTSSHPNVVQFLVNDQHDAQFFSMYLLQFSTCFEQPRAHHQENQLYQYNIWHMSLCVGDHFVCRSERNFPTCTQNGHRHRVTCTRCCIDTIDSPDDEHEVARNM